MLCPASLSLLAVPALLVHATPLAPRAGSSPVNTTICNGKTYMYDFLAGYGKLAGNSRDKYGDTIGGIGSAIALDHKSVKYTKKTRSYEGTIYGLPDRGWNTQGTQNTQTRIHKFSFVLQIMGNATVESPSAPNFLFMYEDTILLTVPDGTPLTGLDPTDVVKYDGFPDLPLAKYTGDGFGNSGPGGARVALDTEGLVLGHDNTYWISDEYGPYIYQFNNNGTMLRAVRAPDALIPIRNGTESFSAASPPIYDAKFKIQPEDPTSGRANNQGLEALTASPDGKYLYTMLQSSTMQDGGKSSSKRRNTRFLSYRVKDKSVTLEAEYVVQLPILPSGKVAGQSEMIYVSDTQFLVLARDSGAGYGQSNSQSVYRNADVIDISGATNVAGKYDAVNGSIASRDGVLNSNITPAEYCPFLSYNVNSQLNRFGVHNGGAQDVNLLNEKWESFAFLQVDCNDDVGLGDKDGKGEDYYLISFSDDDFITQHEIRLLRIAPGPEGSPIEISIALSALEPHTGPLSNCEQAYGDDRVEFDSSPVVYDALSYEWGDPEDRKYEVSADGESIQVGENLFLALRYMRREGYTGNLWIDAICINQGDNYERSHQVQMMGLIYQCAQRVRVWLGVERSEPLGVLWKLDEDYDELDSSARNEISWGELYWVLNQPYWTRVWIFQEYVLAKDVIICYGNYSAVSGPTLEMALQMVYSHKDWIFLYDMFRNSPGAKVVTMRAPPNGLRRRTLFEVIEDTLGSQCQDPRDRIYAIMNLAEDLYQFEEQIPVDYNIGISALRKDVVRAAKRMKYPHYRLNRLGALLSTMFADCPGSEEEITLRTVRFLDSKRAHVHDPPNVSCGEVRGGLCEYAESPPSEKDYTDPDYQIIQTMTLAQYWERVLGNIL
ncbi:hypothetical protein ACEQ8H_007040 [Pleosporales sp. CAS-2024a]